MIGIKEIQALIDRDNSMVDVQSQLDTWGIDVDEWRAVVDSFGANAMERMAQLPLDMALSLAWGGGFLIGYAARLEVEAETAAEEPERFPDTVPTEFLRGDGPDEDNEVHEQPECQRCGSDTYAVGTLDYEGCSDCKEAGDEG